VRRAWGVAAAAIQVLAAPAALAGAAGAPRADAMPSYVIPNIVGLVMVAAILAIACKRYRRG